jgi:hypothetical protein
MTDWSKINDPDLYVRTGMTALIHAVDGKINAPQRSPPEKTPATTAHITPRRRHCRAPPEPIPEREASPRMVQNQIGGNTKLVWASLPRIKSAVTPAPARYGPEARIGRWRPIKGSRDPSSARRSPAQVHGDQAKPQNQLRPQFYAQVDFPQSRSRRKAHGDMGGKITAAQELYTPWKGWQGRSPHHNNLAANPPQESWCYTVLLTGFSTPLVVAIQWGRRGCRRPDGPTWQWLSSWARAVIESCIFAGPCRQCKRGSVREVGLSRWAHAQTSREARVETVWVADRKEGEIGPVREKCLIGSSGWGREGGLRMWILAQPVTILLFLILFFLFAFFSFQIHIKEIKTLNLCSNATIWMQSTYFHIFILIILFLCFRPRSKMYHAHIHFILEKKILLLSMWSNFE